MRRRFVLSLFAAACLPAFAFAQAPKEKEVDPLAAKDETVETFDGVKLRCRFYRAQKDANGSCVILMSEYGKDPNKGDWDGFARLLAASGFNVVRFDFRGHGQSTDIIPSKFWAEHANTSEVIGANKTPPKSSINFDTSKSGSGFKPHYFPNMVQDLAAARNVIDLKNDNGGVNARSVYIIAPGNTAGLAMLFLATEWSREQVKPTPMVPFGVVAAPALTVRYGGSRTPGADVAGKDYAGLVLLSPSRNANLSPTVIKKCVSTFGKDSTGDLRKETPMLVLYGEKDKAGMAESKFYFDEVMVSAGRSSPRLEKLEFSYIKPIPGTDLKGVDLLGKNDQLKTEDTILAFLAKMEEQRKKPNPIKRNYEKPTRIVLSSFLEG